MRCAIEARTKNTVVNKKNIYDDKEKNQSSLA